jgi:hypothetical protein
MNKILHYQAQQSNGSRPLAELSSAMLIITFYLCCPCRDVYLPVFPGVTEDLKHMCHGGPLAIAPGTVETGHTKRLAT